MNSDGYSSRLQDTEFEMFHMTGEDNQGFSTEAEAGPSDANLCSPAAKSPDTDIIDSENGTEKPVAQCSEPLSERDVQILEDPNSNQEPTELLVMETVNRNTYETNNPGSKRKLEWQTTTTDNRRHRRECRDCFSNYLHFGLSLIWCAPCRSRRAKRKKKHSDELPKFDLDDIDDSLNHPYFSSLKLSEPPPADPLVEFEIETAEKELYDSRNHKAIVSVTFKKSLLDKMHPNETLWSNEESLNKDETIKCKVGLIKENDLCWIKLTNSSSPDVKKIYQIHWKCTEYPKEIFTGDNEGQIAPDVAIDCLRCDLESLRSDWKMKFEFSSSVSVDDDENWDWALISKSGDLYPKRKKGFRPRCIMRVNWTINDVTKYVLRSKPFGDGGANANVAMCLEVYPCGEARFWPHRLEVHLRMLQFPTKDLWIRSSTTLNDYTNYVEEKLSVEKEKIMVLRSSDEIDRNDPVKITFDILGIGTDFDSADNFDSADESMKFAETKILGHCDTNIENFVKKLKCQQNFSEAMHHFLQEFPKKMPTPERSKTFLKLAAEYSLYIAELYKNLLPKEQRIAIITNEEWSKVVAEEINDKNKSLFEDLIICINNLLSSDLRLFAVIAINQDKLDAKNNPLYLYFKNIRDNFPSKKIQKLKIFKPIRKYFEAFVSYNSILHAAYIINELAKIKKKSKTKKKLLDEDQKEELIDTMKFLDERITTIVDHIIVQDEDTNLPIMKSYLEAEYKILGYKTSVIDVLVKNKCTSFITSDIFANIVKKSWKGTKTDRSDVIISCFMWMAYIPFLLFINLSSSILFFAGCCEKIGKCCQSSSAKDQTNLELCINKLHMLHDKYKFENIPTLTSFIMDGIMQLVFIILMGYFVIRSMHFSISNIEIFLYLYIIGIIMNELNQIYERRSDYFKDYWNYVDGLVIMCMVFGFVIKFIFSNLSFYQEQRNCSDVTVNQGANILKDCTSVEANDRALYMARFFLCCGLIASFVKISQMTLYFKRIGPVQSMITNMFFKDLVPFVVIFFIYILAFGISFSALTYPNSYTETVNITMFDLFSARKVFIFGFYGLAGQYPILELVVNEANPDNDEVLNHGKPHPWSRGSVAYFLLPLYIMIINILLLNLLIARFSSTVQRIQEKSKFYLNRSVYSLLKDYETRFILPPPLNILSMVFEMIKFLCKKLEIGCRRDTLEKKDIDAFKWHVFYCKLQYETLKKENICKFHPFETSEAEGKAEEITKRIEELVKEGKQNKEKIDGVMQLLKNMNSTQNANI